MRRSVEMISVQQEGDAGHGFAFSLAFVDVVFGILPCLYAIVAAAVSIVLGASTLTLSIRGKILARQWNLVSFLLQLRYHPHTNPYLLQMHIAALAALQLASLVAYLQHDATTAISTAAYAVRLAAAVLALGIHLLLEPSRTLPVDFFFLASLVCDCVRIQTVWRASSSPLAALQTGVIAANAIVVLLGEVFAPKRLVAGPDSALRVSEANSGPLEMLFLGWVGPLIRYGNKNRITTEQLVSVQPLSLAVHNPTNETSERVFLTSAALHFAGAMMLQILGAGATLLQPVIISAIVSNLQLDRHDSTGSWLIVAMFFE